MSRVVLLCPSCESQVEASDLTPICPRCGARISLQSGTGFEAGAAVERCAVCGSEALHIAKDFNKNLGVLIVALGCVGFLWGAVTGIATLVGLTILDRIVDALRPLVTVCYACKSVYRGHPTNPKHHGYELTYDETFEGTGAKPTFEPPTSQSPL